jgi:hypothetical protein
MPDRIAGAESRGVPLSGPFGSPRRGRARYLDQIQVGAGGSARVKASRAVAATIALLLVAGLSPLPLANAATDGDAARVADAGSEAGAEPVSEAKDLAAAKAAARAQGAPVESLADRSETATVRALPDGRLSAELFAAPVRYKDREGTWQNVDVTLRQDPDGAIVPVAHPAALRFVQ